MPDCNRSPQGGAAQRGMEEGDLLNIGTLVATVLYSLLLQHMANTT